MQKNKFGFTLIEIIVTLTIVAVLAAITTPLVIGYVNSAKRVSNHNIARSLFLAAQSELSEFQRTRELKNFTKDFYNTDGSTKGDTKVYELVTISPNPDAQNQDYVHYILHNGNAADPVTKLMGKSILDQGILEGSISVEFNIKTGVVRGVYYSPNLALTYGAGAQGDENSLINPQNRNGTDKIGYYGVDETGKMPPRNDPVFVNIFDGKTKPLETGTLTSTTENVLYVEMLVPKAVIGEETNLNRSFNLDILPKDRKSVLHTMPLDLTTPLPASLDDAINTLALSSGDQIAFQTKTKEELLLDGVNVQDSYDRVVLVLDIFYKTTNAFDTQKHSIAVKYPELKGDLTARLTAKDSGQKADSTDRAHAFFANGSSDTVLSRQGFITSARHLNNVRLVDNLNFRQLNDVDVAKIPMAPLTYRYSGANGKLDATEHSFQKQYTAIGKDTATNQLTNYQIKDLQIEDNERSTVHISHVGLFGHIENGEIIGIFLNQGKISSNNISTTALGGVAGKLTNTSLKNCLSYTTVAADDIAAAVGGIVGELDGTSTLQTSYSGGYYDAVTTPNSLTATDSYGSVTVQGTRNSAIGGIAGRNAGEIMNCYNNARVNIINVDIGVADPNKTLSMLKSPASGSYADLTGTTSYLGGVAGLNSTTGSIQSCYATNYVGKGKTATGEQSKSGGIAGKNEGTVQKSLYIRNGLSGFGETTQFDAAKNDAKGLSKHELTQAAGLLGAAFKNSAFAYVQGKHEAKDYPYPMLSILHQTGWEDIKEAVTEVDLSYYESYLSTTGTLEFGYYSLDSKKKVKSTLREDTAKADALAVNDGYCLELDFASQYDIMINDVKFTLLGKGNSTDPQWEWVANPAHTMPMTNLPVFFAEGEDGTVDGKPSKPIYRLFLNNNTLKSLMPTTSTSQNNAPIRLEVKIDDQAVLNGSSDSTRVYFNPLFSKELYRDVPCEKTASFDPKTLIVLDGGDRQKLTVRSPRQLDNLDSIRKTSAAVAPAMTFFQELHLDFKEYRTELAQKNLNATTKVPEDKSLIEGTFYDLYEGNNKYIRNIKLSSNDESLGVFSSSGGTIQNLALVDTAIVSHCSNGAVGGLVGKTLASSAIKKCQISGVTVAGTQLNQTIGGIAGQNKGYISEVYFNSAIQDNNKLWYVPAVSGKEAYAIGGMIGDNTVGILEYAYTTGIGPMVDKKIFPTIGKGIIGSEVYYLSLGDFNNQYNKDDKPFAEAEQGKPLAPNDLTALAKSAAWKDSWVTAKISTTKFTRRCVGKAYQFPQLKGMNHYTDWPILSNLARLTYYEIYENGEMGSFYYDDFNKPVDNTFNISPVVEDGYLLEVMNEDPYRITFNMEELRTNEVIRDNDFYGKKVIIMKNSALERCLKEYNGDGVKVCGIQMEDQTGNSVMFGSSDGGSNYYFYFNPLFAKKIYPTKPMAALDDDQYKFEIRSPRQIDNIDFTKETLSKAYDQKLIRYQQTCDIDFANYRKDRAKDPMKFNSSVVKDVKQVYFGAAYDGGYENGVYSINNLLITGTSYNAALFNKNFGTISNLAFENASVSGGSTVGVLVGNNNGVIDGISVNNAIVNGDTNTYVGGIAGINNDKLKNDEESTDVGKISNCTVSDSTITKGGTKGEYTGGITGSNDHRTAVITNCKVIRTTVSGYNFVGGIAGNNFSGASILGCAVIDSTVQNVDQTRMNIGGISGRNDFLIENSFVSGTKVLGDRYVGGITGMTVTDATIRNCFYNGAKSNPQTADFEATITGNAGRNNIGGITGSIAGSILENVYFSGYMNAGNATDTANYIAGYSSGKNALTNVYYLQSGGYNSKPVTNYNATAVGIDELRELATSFGNRWMSGPDATAPNPTRYPYPILTYNREEIPAVFAMPDQPVFRMKYYENYADDTTGLWSDNITPATSTLKDTEPIIEDGYLIKLDNVKDNDAVYSIEIGTDPGKIITTIPSVRSTEFTDTQYSGSRQITLPMADLLNAAQGLRPIYVAVKDKAGKLVYDSYINPLFAKAVFYEKPFGVPPNPPATEPPAAGTPPEPPYEYQFDPVLARKYPYEIRTPRQMQSISRPDPADKHPDYISSLEGSYVQERDLDFVGDIGVLAPLTASVIEGEFKGSFDGKGKTIQNVTIEANTDNIGLFSQNSGTIANINLIPTINIKGENNVGFIAGHNLADGIIKNCTVIGQGTTLEGNTNVGGIVGFNEGTVQDCTVENTTATIKGKNNVGGIAGVNNGKLLRCQVNNVVIVGDIAADGIVGGIAGENGAVGTIKNCTLNQVALVRKDQTATLVLYGSNLNVVTDPALDKTNTAKDVTVADEIPSEPPLPPKEPIKLPEAEEPEPSNPESEKPESEKPESENPESSNPESNNPETEKPESSKPEVSDVVVSLTNFKQTGGGSW